MACGDYSSMVKMRRVPAILLVFLFGFSPIASALFVDDQSNLPACCRRDGKHHCGMTDRDMGSTQQFWKNTRNRARPAASAVAGASVKLQAITSDWSQTAQADDNGEFSFTTVPVGDYKITVTQSNSRLRSRPSPSLPAHRRFFTFNWRSRLESNRRVVGQAETANMDSVTPTTLVDREDIAQTPGADRTNSMAMITDYTPGAYVTHDMLHMRGGHQVDWLIDGVPVPNTNIATNLGPQIDPKDIDYLEVQRGSYDAEYGDRTYGIFNIVPRTGFERDNEAELVTSFGNWYQTNDQLNFGGHTKRFAYYASVNGNRSDYGLQPPIGQVVHDAENGYGGFASFIFNASSSNQFRLVASLRQDYYQIPIDPNPNSAGNQVYPSYGLRDSEREPDGYVTFSWIHTFQSKPAADGFTLLSLQPGQL
jgi:hypothetical protein